ncbi:MAG TPA: ester cyclase [Ktedonobacteraceae bacterium]
MSTEDNKALMRRAYEEVYNQRNLAVLDELCVPDFVYHSASMTIQGLEAYKHFASLLFAAFPNGRFSIEDMIAEGDRVVVRHTFRGSHQGDFRGIAPTDKQVTTTAIVISRIANGKAIEAWFNGDDLGRMQQLGVIPVPGQAS